MKNLLFLLVWVALVPGAFARNELCRESFLKSLKIGNVSSLPFSNVCDLRPEEVPAALRSTIAQLKDLNLGIARAFGAEPEAFFKDGIKLSIVALESGPISSVAGMMAVYPEWAGGPVEPAVYVHEIGHVLMYLDHVPALTALSRNTVINEAFPDLLSRTVMNRPGIDFIDPTLPACGRNLRPAKPSFSYSFRDLFGLHEAVDYQKCCESIPDEEKSPHFKSQCDSKKSYLTYLSTLREGPAFAADCVDRGKPPLGSYRPKRCPGHVFSSPLDHFLGGVEALSGKSKFELVVDSSRIVHRRGDFDCKEVKTGKVSRPTGSAVMSFSEVLRTMRGFVPGSLWPEFDRLWREANVDFATGLDDLEVRRMLEMRLSRYENVCLPGESLEGCEYVCAHVGTFTP